MKNRKTLFIVCVYEFLKVSDPGTDIAYSGSYIIHGGTATNYGIEYIKELHVLFVGILYFLVEFTAFLGTVMKFFVGELYIRAYAKIIGTLLVVSYHRLDDETSYLCVYLSAVRHYGHYCYVYRSSHIFRFLFFAFRHVVVDSCKHANPMLASVLDDLVFVDEVRRVAQAKKSLHIKLVPEELGYQHQLAVNLS